MGNFFRRVRKGERGSLSLEEFMTLLKWDGDSEGNLSIHTDRNKHRGCILSQNTYIHQIVYIYIQIPITSNYIHIQIQISSSA